MRQSSKDAAVRVAIWSDPSEVHDRLEAEFARILTLLVDRDDVEQVWRFGSSIAGTVHATSDLDLLVVQRSDLGPVERAVALREQLAVTVPVDLFVVTPEEFDAGGRFLDDVRARGRRER